VVGGMALGVSLIIAFIIIELKSKDPMFNLGLFKIKEFSSGIVSLFLSGIARGGLQFMLIIWLQGINTPLQAGIDMTPLLAGFLLFGPTSGYLSDRYGARRLKIIGMTINVFGFLMLAILPVNFAYADFAVIIFLLGAGQGMFAAPNTISIMNSVPPQNRGATSGIQGTLTNASFMFSMVVFFTILIFGLGATLPKVLYNGLIMQNVPNQTAATVSKLPPTSALFAALLGYNPMQTLLSNATSSIPKANLTVITGTKFFPSLISNSFKSGMRIVMFVAAAMAAIVAIISALRKETKIKEAGAQ
jgi:MFS family permease